MEIKGQLLTDIDEIFTDDVLLHLLTFLLYINTMLFHKGHSSIQTINSKALIHKMNLDTIDSRLHKGEL